MSLAQGFVACIPRRARLCSGWSSVTREADHYCGRNGAGTWAGPRGNPMRGVHACSREAQGLPSAFCLCIQSVQLGLQRVRGSGTVASFPWEGGVVWGGG